VEISVLVLGQFVLGEWFYPVEWFCAMSLKAGRKHKEGQETSYTCEQCGAQVAKCRVKGLALLNGTAKLCKKRDNLSFIVYILAIFVTMQSHREMIACSLHSTSLDDNSIVCR